MTTEEALKIAENPTGGHGITGVREAFRVLADALREAQAQTVQMREVVRQDHCDYGDACVLHKMKEVVSTLPAPAARTYDDAIRDAAKAIRDQAIRTFGKPTTVANGYAEVVESLLSPAPAVAPVEKPHGCCKGPTPPGGCAMDRNGVCDLAPVAAPRPLHPADCAHDSTPEVSVPHMPDPCGFVADADHVACVFPRGHAGWHRTPPVAVPKPRVIVAPPIDFSEEDAPDEKPVAFDAEKALVAMRAKLIDVMSEQFASDFGDVIDAGLAAGRGAR